MKIWAYKTAWLYSHRARIINIISPTRIALNIMYLALRERFAVHKFQQENGFLPNRQDNLVSKCKAQHLNCRDFFQYPVSTLRHPDNNILCNSPFIYGTLVPCTV